MSSPSLDPDSAANIEVHQSRPTDGETPCPYEQDKLVALSITKTFSDEVQVGPLDATITKVYSMTMSPVVEIVYNTKSGATQKAVLKIFDSRFGRSFRYVCGPPGKFNGYVTHTASRAKAWREYVRDGKAEALFEEIRAGQEQYDFRCPAQYHLDAPATAPDHAAARYEGALQYEALEHFASETRAYERLAGLQGRGIPKLLAHVRLRLRVPPVPAASSDSYGQAAQAQEQRQEEEEEEEQPPPPPETARFFQVNGIIMEHIDGFSLDTLAASPLPVDRWASVLQRAVDVVTEINLRGVVLGDGRPGNVIVEMRSAAPFVHDFAQSRVFFSVGAEQRTTTGNRDLALKTMTRSSDDEKTSSDDEKTSFGVAVYQSDNPRHLILWLAMRLREEKRVDVVGVKYPDFYRLLGLEDGRVAGGHGSIQQFPLPKAQVLVR